MSVNVYQIVTERIIEELKNGVIPWQKPWVGGQNEAINFVTRKPYSLLNQILLGKPGEWLTFKQIQDKKACLRAGAKSRIVVYFTLVDKKETNEEETINKKFPILKYYRVFHIDDVKGLESKIKEEKFEGDPIEEAETIINDYLKRENLTFRLGDNKAFYSPLNDVVVVPERCKFKEVPEYYSTTFHELTHSTMHEKRCNRREENKNSLFGNFDYSREELVAEIGAAMLCNYAHIDCDKAFKNSIAYIQSWLRALNDDPKMIVWASSRAEKAAKYIIGETAENEDIE